jgi:hypothetical protein
MYAEDEELYYMLVPQKRAHPLVFTIMLQERQSDGSYAPYNHLGNYGSEQWHKNGMDEFLVYTKCLSFYDEYFKENPGQYEEIKDVAWEGEVTMINEESWSTNGRVMAFRSYGYEETDGYKYGLQEDGTYNVYMLTNSSSNKDIVRVSSNNTYNYHAFEYTRDSVSKYDHNYGGNEYRSVIFDVAHYRPYRFAAQLRISDGLADSPVTLIPADSELMSNETHGSQEENIDDVEFSYKPGQEVDILLDITSFKGSDGRSVHPFGEVFGMEFDVYIDAPMLEIDYERIPANWLKVNNPALTADKLRKHPTIPGRFIYTVEREREDERKYGFATAHNQDLSTSYYDNFGRIVSNTTQNQSGERKCLPFKKTAITVGGDISISTDSEKVVFWQKRFSIDTKHIMGEILYEKDGTRRAIPKDAFVAFVRLRTGARIGVVTITEDGRFELNLRDEYQFAWEDDSIDFYYTDANGTVYNFNYKEDGIEKPVDLNLLYTLTEQNTPIVLTAE